jgi:lysophospholipase L1-like esterase
LLCVGRQPQTWYQYYMYRYLKTRSIETSIPDYGIGGQVVAQICERMYTNLPATYITVMAGTNDVLRANYSDPNVNATLATHIIDTYKNTLPGIMDYQANALHYPKPAIFICTVPPLAAQVPIAPDVDVAKATSAIEYVNSQIKAYVAGLGDPNYVLVDTNRNLKGPDNHYIPGLCVSDGIHPSEDGYEVIGDTIAQKIFEKYYGKI